MSKKQDHIDTAPYGRNHSVVSVRCCKCLWHFGVPKRVWKDEGMRERVKCYRCGGKEIEETENVVWSKFGRR